MNDNTEPASLTAALTTLTVLVALTGIWTHALTDGLNRRTAAAFAVTAAMFAVLTILAAMSQDT